MKTMIRYTQPVTSTTMVHSRHPVEVYHCTQSGVSPAFSTTTSGRVEPAPALTGAKPREQEHPEHDADIVFRLYAREIGQVELLTPEDETRLARQIQKGDEAARELMIKANLRLVVKIARDFDGYGMPLLDLISEGNIGLMKAVERFDPGRGAKLSTYAAFYIKQAMRRSIADCARLIRLPVYAQEKILEIHRAESRLRELLGRTPTDEEISDEIRLPSSKVRRLRTASVQPASLDASLDDDECNPVAEVVADEHALAPDQQYASEDAAKLVRELMEHLPAREQQVIRHRFGFEGGGEMTLDEIGAELGLTRERIRQIQNSALRRLRGRIEARETVRLAA